MFDHEMYTLTLAALSCAVAMLGAFSAFQLAVAIPLAQTARQRSAIVMTAGAAMGLGAIWAVQCMALLATHLGVSVNFDATLIALSALLAFAACSLGLMLVGDGNFNLPRLSIAALCIGAGLLGTHYLAMMSLLMPATIEYDRRWVEVSAAIAIIGPMIALWIAFHLRGALQLFSSALVMGATSCVVHVTTMMGVRLEDNGGQLPENFANGLHAQALQTAIAAVVVTLLVLVLGSFYLQYRRRATITI